MHRNSDLVELGVNEWEGKEEQKSEPEITETEVTEVVTE